MSTEQCQNCSEVVDAAKAFCPSCGSSFVAEETREKASEFEASAGTVQYSSSMFNELLSDMDLNISGAPNKPEKTSGQTLSPVAPASVLENTSTGLKTGSRKRWFIIGGIALGLTVFLAVFLAVAAVLLYLNFDRIRPYVG
jgi:hypothetical protein